MKQMSAFLEQTRDTLSFSGVFVLLAAGEVVMLGNSELVGALLGAGADLTVRDPVCGLTVLHDAAREGFEDTVRVLLDHGADVNVTDDRGYLPLHLADMKGHKSVVKLLIGRTAFPQNTNGEGRPAM